jgi:uncharacterized protein (TIGR00251 family)
MDISVRVIPRSRRVEIKPANGVLKVYLTKPAVEGQANGQLIEVLADHFKLRKYQVKIKRGQNSRNKIVNIEDVPANRSKKRSE